MHVLVERAARAHPAAVALEFEGATLTYAELDARATRLARRLRALRVGVESRVGVCAVFGERRSPHRADRVSSW